MLSAEERLDNDGWFPSWIRFEHEQRYQFAANFVNGKTVLDCACGSGFGTLCFARSGAKTLIGIDCSESALALARTRLADFDACFRHADVSHLPVTDSSIDVVISLETIEHLADDARFLSEITRVLHDDGVLIISTPNRTVTNPGRSLRDKPWNRHHVREYDMNEFQGLLTSRFASCAFYGQSWASRHAVCCLSLLARIAPCHTAVRVRQLMKLPFLFLDRARWHTVEPIQTGRLYECITAVCRQPH